MRQAARRRLAGRLALAVVAGAAAWPASAGAQASWRDQIARQLDASRLIAGYRGEGFTETHDRFFDLMEAGGRRSVPVDLQAGRTYHFVGKCDNDCTDLDFRLYDESGTLVDSDVGTDDVPVVTVTPRRAATFRLSVEMTRCATRTCGWGVAVLGGNGGASGASTGEARIVARDAANSAGPAPASPASSRTWQEQVRTLLEGSAMVTRSRGEGFTDAHAPFYDLVPAGASRDLTLDLQAGRTYQFVGKCDADCSDLDLRLFDPGDALVASDVATDDIPLMRATATRDGRYRLRVTMVSCRTSTCGWGVAVLGK